jgi:hypothetical protein
MGAADSPLGSQRSPGEFGLCCHARLGLGGGQRQRPGALARSRWLAEPEEEDRCQT